MSSPDVATQDSRNSKLWISLDVSTLRPLIHGSWLSVWFCRSMESWRIQVTVSYSTRGRGTRRRRERTVTFQVMGTMGLGAEGTAHPIVQNPSSTSQEVLSPTAINFMKSIFTTDCVTTVVRNILLTDMHFRPRFTITIINTFTLYIYILSPFFIIPFPSTYTEKKKQGRENKGKLFLGESAVSMEFSKIKKIK